MILSMNATRSRAFAPLAVLALTLAAVPALAQAGAVTVAFTAARNLDVDPRTDYVGGLVQGLILYDLTRAPGVVLVDRSSLDRVLAEQELQLSGLVDDRTSALKVGKLLGADYLVSADFLAMAGEVLVTIRVTNVATGRTGAFAERGPGENTIHRAAESLVEYLSGKRPAFVDPEGDRNIVNLKDESPGSVALHSPLIRAEIYLDGAFVGYTTGKVDVPFVIEKVKPGRHSIRTTLGRGFGVVKLPEISFGDWEEAFELSGGERKVLRDRTRDWNSVLYELQYFYDDDFYWEGDAIAKASAPRAVSFVDRKGATVEVRLELRPDESSGSLVLSPRLAVGAETGEWKLVSKKGEEVELEATLGLVKLELSIDNRYGRVRVELQLERTDVWQGMY